MPKKQVTNIAAVLFVLVALFHVLRLAFGIDVSIEGWSIPIWPSIAVIVVAGYLSWKLWKS
ncbi:MAG TPA: hypothetical protein VI913_01185 [Candidatus Peribacteraceae bacterium]|nr:hypothetical protein [Candidatus Peribacteraceae bacterium]